MNLFTLPWLELSICVPLVGGLCVGWVRNPVAALRWCLAFAAFTFVCTLLVLVGQTTGESPTGADLAGPAGSIHAQPPTRQKMNRPMWSTYTRVNFWRRSNSR